MAQQERSTKTQRKIIYLFNGKRREKKCFLFLHRRSTLLALVGWLWAAASKYISSISSLPSLQWTTRKTNNKDKRLAHKEDEARATSQAKGNEAEMEWVDQLMKWNAEAADGPPAYNPQSTSLKSQPNQLKLICLFLFNLLIVLNWIKKIF